MAHAAGDGIAALRGSHQLGVDQEQLVGVGAADDQIVVGVFAVVEVEAAQPPFVQQKGDDLLDVDALRMVAEIDQHLRLFAELERKRVGRAPVGDIGAVEGWLEELVLDQHAAVFGQVLIGQRKALFKAPFARTQIVLAGVVGAVGEPQAQIAACVLLMISQHSSRWSSAISRAALPGLPSEPSL